MSLLGGLVNYGDSDDDNEDPGRMSARAVPSAPPVTASAAPGYENGGPPAAIHPAPIPHCPWSACYDESSGFTYYWNQHTNAVTWEAPPEYLLALKVAQQQLNTARNAEVSAEEWQLYQQALAEKRNPSKVTAKGAPSKPASAASNEIHQKPEKRDKKYAKRRRTFSDDDEDEKIELITSYYHSESDSNDESDSPAKSSKVPPKSQPPVPPQTPKPKKAKKQATVEYGPSLPPNQNYTVPIGPELPPELPNAAKSPEKIVEVKEEIKNPLSNDVEDSQDESSLLIKLKNKAKLLEKLGGEIPTELKKIIREEPKSGTASPAGNDKIAPDIDDLLSEIEKKELPKIKSRAGSNATSAVNSPIATPPREESKALFPSSKAIVESETERSSLFPSTADVINDEVNGIDTEPIKSETPPLLPPPEKTEKKNIYLSDSSEVPTTGKKKLRISNSVLPDRTRSEVPTYTTKYSTHIEGFSSEHTGLGFSYNEEADKNSPKATISYGNGLMFTKGEVLNEAKRDEELEDQMDLVEAKLKYLHQVQPCIITPVQEMLIQMQTLSAAYSAGALSPAWWRPWVRAAADALLKQEADAAPPGWSCAFQRSSGRYQYRRLADGFVQLEYPAPPADMDICTTPPPHPALEEACAPPPPPPQQPPLPPPPPPPPLPPGRVHTPPPPTWNDPPPPGTDDLPPLPSEPAKQEIGDELASFYSEITQLEQHVAPPLPLEPPPPAPQPPPPALPPPPCIPPVLPTTPHTDTEDRRDREKEGKKKKSKVKISTSIGMKHKSVSNLVAKWQQVAEEINSD